ncbi:MAG: hypothetical protein QGG50_07305 [Methanopyri archaeon]|jgi:hypothetical protein|nr:hypothetical protein [Methanopyri archaeon]
MIVIIGNRIMDWSLGILPKFLFLLVTSFIGIMVIYELLIHRWNPVRFLFGMKAIMRDA